MTTPHAKAAGTWRLGDHDVHRLGFGAMRIPGGFATNGDREQAVAVLRRAVELGVNQIDTAAFYFSPNLAANELINRALSPYGDDLLIATKVGPGRDPAGEFLPEARPEQLRGQVLENLRQLGRDHLDLVYLRIGAAQGHGEGSLGERFAALAALREEGLIRHLGVSNVGLDQLTEARAIAPVVAVQNWYGLSKRDDDDVLDACTEAGIAFVPFFSVQSGSPDGRVGHVAARHGVTEAQVLLAWTLHRAPNVLAIPGTGSLAHLEENVAAGALELSAADLSELGTDG